MSRTTLSLFPFYYPLRKMKLPPRRSRPDPVVTCRLAARCAHPYESTDTKAAYCVYHICIRRLQPVQSHIGADFGRLSADRASGKRWTLMARLMRHTLHVQVARITRECALHFKSSFLSQSRSFPFHKRSEKIEEITKLLRISRIKAIPPIQFKSFEDLTKFYYCSLKISRSEYSHIEVHYSKYKFYVLRSRCNENDISLVNSN